MLAPTCIGTGREETKGGDGKTGERARGENRGVKKKERKEERETGRDATRTKRKRIRGAHD